MILFALLLALVIGIVLAMIGSGGSILTVPVLVYLLKIEPVTATAYSLFIVGMTALAGAIPYWKRGELDRNALIWFSFPSIAAVWLTRAILLPALPDVWLTLGAVSIGKGQALMILFAGLMLVSAILMLRDAPPLAQTSTPRRALLVLEGAVVGVLTGLVGAGGGFLIIPALVLLAGLPMKTAVGTSLALIALKSIIGFSGDLTSGLAPDWLLLLSFTSVAILGILLGARFVPNIDARNLKRGFGVFLILVAAAMLVTEIRNQESGISKSHVKESFRSPIPDS
jgi:uncharacterized membrane protein YfcA